MKCAKATSLLQAYLDNELTASKEAQLEYHLKGCTLCRMQLAAFKKTSEAMDLWTDKEPHRDLVSPVIQRLRYEQEAPSAFQRFIEVITANRRKILAIGANLAILIFFVFNVPQFLRPPNDDFIPPMPPTRGSIYPEPATMPSYDPVHIAEYLNDAIDGNNLSPVERDMMVDNIISDANDVSNGAFQLPHTAEPVRFRRVQIIYVHSSKENSTVQRVIFTQQMNYEKTK